LTIQKRDKNMLLGEIIVKMEKLTNDDLEKYIEVYLNMYKKSALNETSQWLGQDEVDKLRSQFIDPETT
jgi:mannitol-1-phosphate/altronate dehydrogenase